MKTDITLTEEQKDKVVSHIILCDRLTYRILNKWGHGSEFQDLKGCAYLTLIKCVVNFKNGGYFRTYLYRALESNLTREKLNTSRTANFNPNNRKKRGDYIELKGYDTDYEQYAFLHTEEYDINKKVLISQMMDFIRTKLLRSEQVVLDLYLDDYNYREMADILNVSPQRIFQIYKKSIDKMKRHFRVKNENC